MFLLLNSPVFPWPTLFVDHQIKLHPCPLSLFQSKFHPIPQASIARSVALSGVDLYAKYSPANYVPNSQLSSLARSRSLTDTNRGHTPVSTNTTVKLRKSSNQSDVASSHRRVQVYDDPDKDPNNNTVHGISKSDSKSSLRRPVHSVALGGAGSYGLLTADPIDSDNKVTTADPRAAPPKTINATIKPGCAAQKLVASSPCDVSLSCAKSNNTTKSSPHPKGKVTRDSDTGAEPRRNSRTVVVGSVIKARAGEDLNNNKNNNNSTNNTKPRIKGTRDDFTRKGARVAHVLDNADGKTMFLRQNNGNSSPQRSLPFKSPMLVTASNCVRIKRDAEIFLRDECDLVRNELMQKKMAEHNPIPRNIPAGATNNNTSSSCKQTQPNGSSSPMDTSDDHSPSIANGSRLRSNKMGLRSPYSSSASSSASSLMESGSRQSILEDIKFIDSDDNTETNGSRIGGQLNKKTLGGSSTLDSLKTSTPVVGGKHHQYTSITNGHRTLPYQHSSDYGGLHGGEDYSRKYSTLSSLPSTKTTTASVRNGFTNGLYEDRSPRLYSKDAIVMGLVDTNDHRVRTTKETAVQSILTSSEPPNDRIHGKSWEVNGSPGGGSSVSGTKTILFVVFHQRSLNGTVSGKSIQI